MIQLKKDKWYYHEQKGIYFKYEYTSSRRVLGKYQVVWYRSKTNHIGSFTLFYDISIRPVTTWEYKTKVRPKINY